MFFTPSSILGLWFRGLMAIGLIGLAGWLFYQWQDNLPQVIEYPVDSENPSLETVPATLSFRERVSLWRPDLDWTTAALIGSIIFLATSLFGQWIASPLIFKRKGEDDPNFKRTGEVYKVKRPDGTVLQVEFYGPEEGQPIILTHGWSNDSAVWYYVKKHLSHKYRLIVWDLPGHGLSTKATNNDYSVERFANDLKAVVEFAQGKPAILLGHSLGGMTVQMYCKLFPQEVKQNVLRIILFATTYTNPLKTTKFASLKLALQKPLIEPLLYLTIYAWPLVWLMNWLSYINGSVHRSTERSSFYGNETRGQLNFCAWYSAKDHPAVMARGLLQMLRYDVSCDLQNIPVPALVIDCAQDEVILPEALSFIRKHIPTNTGASLDKTRHMGNIERNDQFSKLVDLFSDSSDVVDFDGKQIVVSPNSHAVV